MKNYNEKILSVLTELIVENLETEFCYKTAAEKVSDVDLKTIFVIYTKQRRDYSTELKNAAKRLANNEITLDSELITTNQNRLINNFKKYNTKEILTECYKIEKESIELYKKILKIELPVDLKELIDNQYREIIDAHDKLKLLVESR